MKKAFTDLKSFVTIWLMFLLAIVVVANLFGRELSDPVLLLFTNTLTSVVTYYFTKKKNDEEIIDEEKEVK